MPFQSLKIFSYIFLLFIFSELCSSGSTDSTQLASENIYIHVDRSSYVAGENIFFKLYLLNETTHKLSTLSKIAYLVLRNKWNDQIIEARLKITNGIAYGSFLLPDSLSSGPYLLTAFTNWMRNDGEENYFNEEIFVANRFDKEIQIQKFLQPGKGFNSASGAQQKLSVQIVPDKTIYDKREKVHISLVIANADTEARMNVSISVSETVPGNTDSISISNYLHEKTVNSQNVSKGIAEKWIFLPEQKGEIIMGKLTEAISVTAIPNSCVFLSAIDTFANLQYSYSDSSGHFQFLLGDYYDGKDFVLSIRNNSKANRIKIELEDKFQLQTKFKTRFCPVKSDVKDFIQNSQDIVSISKIYQDESQVTFVNRTSDKSYIPVLYFKPDYKIFPAEFEPLPDFIELSREIIPPQFKLRNQGGIYSAYMADENTRSYFDEDPVIFLDGVLIDNINQVINFGSDRVRKIELISKSYNYGNLIFPGILSISSTNHEIKKMQPFSTSFWHQLQKFHPISLYLKNDYSMEGIHHTPIFRQLLSWEPNVKIKQKITNIPEFITSDHAGIYTIKVEGISSEGIPISESRQIRVK